jgi:hypothetical protein
MNVETKLQCNSMSDDTAEIPRHVPDNPYNYSPEDLIVRKKALRDLVLDYPTLPVGWLEMAYDFEKNTPHEEIKKIIADKLWEGPGKFSEIMKNKI